MPGIHLEKQGVNSTSSVANNRKRSSNNALKLQLQPSTNDLTKISNAASKNLQPTQECDKPMHDNKQNSAANDRNSAITSNDRLTSFETTVDLITRRCARPFFANELTYHVLNETNQLSHTDVISDVINEVTNEETGETREKQEGTDIDQRRGFTIDNLLN